MERFNREQPQERAERSPGKARKAGLPPWYKPQELQKIGQELNESHCNSRSDGLQYCHGQPQDRDVIPSDDYGHASPVFGTGFTPQLDASASSASDQGTLAGRNYSAPQLGADRGRFSAQLRAHYKRGGTISEGQKPYRRVFQYDGRAPNPLDRFVLG